MSEHAIKTLGAFVLDLVRVWKSAPQSHSSMRLASCMYDVASKGHDPGEVLGALEILCRLPDFPVFLAESGVRSSMGERQELRIRLLNRFLPLAPAENSFVDALRLIFEDDAVAGAILSIPADEWISLLQILPSGRSDSDVRQSSVRPLVILDSVTIRQAVVHALRLVSHRLCGAALDRGLLDMDPELERHESPFVVQNEEFVQWLARTDACGSHMTNEDADHLEVLIEQCRVAIRRIRRRMHARGVTVRMTHLVVRMEELTERMSLLLNLLRKKPGELSCIVLCRSLLEGHLHRHAVFGFVTENMSMLARNVTEHASRHGEHYIAEDRREWRGIFFGAAGAGVLIAAMAFLKIRISLLALPPLTEGLLFGLNYGVGFMLIHVLGFTIATKQPAMTAASIAASLETSTSRDDERLQTLIKQVA